MTFEDFASLTRNSAVARKIRRQEHRAWTELTGAGCGHRRTHAKPPRLVRGGTNDRAIAAPGHDDGLSAEFRIVPLFDGRVKGVHVDVYDFSHGQEYPFYALGFGGVHSRARLCPLLVRRIAKASSSKFGKS